MRVHHHRGQAIGRNRLRSLRLGDVYAEGGPALDLIDDVAPEGIGILAGLVVGPVSADESVHLYLLEQGLVQQMPLYLLRLEVCQLSDSKANLSALLHVDELGDALLLGHAQLEQVRQMSLHLERQLLVVHLEQQDLGLQVGLGAFHGDHVLLDELEKRANCIDALVNLAHPEVITSSHMQPSALVDSAQHDCVRAHHMLKVVQDAL